ncbi:tetratricopeptide repeat-containing sensor histidine kinase [Chryseobacterium shandongense]|uniref:tetratricopeptide repeat-containing sensor histidine kinase n=1 Tax=Chryseobacterium shandongense TaxID=1493872 RepID=UPI000F5020DC|nr:tetratricopeptide repeat-containing sensor histidine kinase [Chryseobacterium shandongense]AZA55804.1 ATP-binding protein [Chryseobacterium shandongense]
MKNYFLFILLILLFSCSEETSNIKNDSIANTYYKKAKKLTGDSAYYYYNLAKNSYLDIKDSSGVGRSLVNMAIIQYYNGDYYGSIETSLEGNRYLKNVNNSIVRATLGSSYNNMGISSSYLYDYENAVKSYNQALKYANKSNDIALYHNNLGDALMSLKNYKSAEKNFILALRTKDKISYARALNNLARAKYNLNPEYNPLPLFYKALQLREQEGNPVEENSSYATLSNYFLDKDNKEKALEYAKKMLAVSRQKNSKEDQAQALQKIVNLDTKNYLPYFREFQILNDSLQISKSKAKNQFAFIRYDVEQKNAAYEKLSKTNFQKNIGILALALGLLVGIFLYKRRKKLLEQEKELEIKNTQLKLSKKVHDVVANGIYQVMTKIENQEHFDKVKALDELEFVYEKSRDISYEKSDNSIEEKDISEKISELIGSFKNESVNTYIAGNEKMLWENVSKTTQDEVYQIIRELLVNMRKHSGATTVSFRFERTENNISINYSDNGVGIPGDVLYKNGLSSTVSRIENISGAIIFDTKTEKGLKINTSFPVS